ncbi:Uncharacterised protein [Chlamydia trachomatis]|nr:Uncharacterised protein [Chlamydia trachomatis]
MWHFDAVSIGIKGKLQDFHTREACCFTQFNHLVRYRTKIFCDDIQITEFSLDGFKEFKTWCLNTIAVNSCFFSRRDFPERSKADEVIDTNHIVYFEAFTETSNPPSKAICFHRIPVIDWIAPKLTNCRKSIWWTAGNNTRTTFFVCLEELRICPHIRRVCSDINRHISDKFNAVFICISLQSMPLAKEEVLCHTVVVNGIRQTSTIVFQGLRLTQTNRIVFPFCPSLQIKMLFDSHVLSKCIQPIFLFF